MYKWIIFDLDGTLCDSLEDIKDSLNKALNYYGFSANYTYNDTKKFIGSGAKVLVKRSLDKFNYNEQDLINCYNLYNEIYHENSMNNLKLFPNTLEMLKAIKEKGYKLGVLSNKPDCDTKKIINTILPNIFDFIQGQVEGVKVKPDKEAILNVSNIYNFKTDEVLYVGDMSNDMELCINSNIDFCLCSFGYDTTGLLNDYKYKINDYQELIDLLV